MFFGRQSSAVALGLVLLLLPVSLFACGFGMTLRKEVGDFRAEMLYNARRIRPGQDVQFHFELYNISNRSYGPGTPINYTTVTATLRDGETVLHQETVPRPSYEETGVEWTLPEENADYVLDITYSKNEEILADTSLPVRVGFGNIWQRFLSFDSSRASLLEGVEVQRN